MPFLKDDYEDKLRNHKKGIVIINKDSKLFTF